LQHLEPGIGGTLARLLDSTLNLLKWLVLPISALLFLQWPLRDFVQQFSREANDLGQILFALYVAASVSAATRAGTHLTASSAAHRYGPRARQAFRVASNCGAVVPWLVFLAWSGTPAILGGLSNLERFQDSLNPGYFVVKLALWLLAATLMLASLLDCRAAHQTAPLAKSAPAGPAS
jgi:TRAP-type C4-dicarboxylate transport system permease small subunit